MAVHKNVPVVPAQRAAEEELLANKKLHIAIDPGFDGMKLVVNMRLYHVYSSIDDITKMDKNDQTNFNYGNPQYLEYEDSEKRYQIGYIARVGLTNTDFKSSAADNANFEKFYDLDRFGTKEFEVCINAALGFALYKYEEETKEEKFKTPFQLSDLKNWEIYVGVALPHQHMDTLWKNNVKAAIVGSHKFMITTKDQCKSTLEYEIKSENAFYHSQAFSALMSYVASEIGAVNGDLKDLLPAIVIDAGYKTLGRFRISIDGRIDMSESDTNYAMLNVDNAVAEKMRGCGYPDMTGYRVEAFVTAGETDLNYEKGSEVETINIEELRDEVIEEYCRKLKSLMIEKYGKLLNIKKLIIAGGTGATYYPYIKEWEKDRTNLRDRIILANSAFYGQKCESVYAIAVGMYKLLEAALLSK